MVRHRFNRTQAALKVLQGASVKDVAREFNVSPLDVEQAVEFVKDAATNPRHLQPILEAMAGDFGYKGQKEYTFTFPDVPGKEYTPDCVWFADDLQPQNAVAVFEIDKDMSPKQMAGGAALAAMTALKLGRRIRFYLIAPRNARQRATNTIELFRRYLGDRWTLDATVILGLNPDVIRRGVEESFEANSY